MTMTDTRLPVDQIRMDGGTQSRAMNSPGVIEEYVDAMRDSAVFPPVVVFFDGTNYWLADGFHRVLAALAADVDVLDADIRQGTQRDAVLYACGANSAHRLQRTNADKNRAVRTLLQDGEWSQWSDREIARQCGVTHPFVSKLRQELSGNGYQINASKLVQRNGTTYTQHTGNIDYRGLRVQLDPVVKRNWVNQTYDVAWRVTVYDRESPAKQWAAVSGNAQTALCYAAVDAVRSAQVVPQ